MKNSGQNNKPFSIDEPEKASPLLSQIKNDLETGLVPNPFSVSADYFDTLNEEVMKKVKSLPDFDSVSPVNPFKVPSGYFDSLPTIIQERIIEGKRFSLREWLGEVVQQSFPKYALAFASIILLLLFSVKYFTRTIRVDYVQQPAVEQELLDAAYLLQLDESTLAEVYSEETLSPSAQENGIETYLLDNDIDLNSITDQL